MRNLLLASVVSLAAVAAVPAFAQSANAPASNIEKSDTNATIAPKLPVPTVAENAGPRQYVRVAKTALQQNRTGEAQEALERAMTRALDVSNDPTAPGALDAGSMLHTISDARDALGHGDLKQANTLIDAALATPPMARTAAATSGTTLPATGGVSSMPRQDPGLLTDTFRGGDDSKTVQGNDNNATTYSRVLPDAKAEGVGPAGDTGGGTNSN